MLKKEKNILVKNILKSYNYIIKQFTNMFCLLLYYKSP